VKGDNSKSCKKTKTPKSNNYNASEMSNNPQQKNNSNNSTPILKNSSKPKKNDMFCSYNNLKPCRKTRIKTAKNKRPRL